MFPLFQSPHHCNKVYVLFSNKTINIKHHLISQKNYHEQQKRHPFISEPEFRLAALDLFSRRGRLESRDWSDTAERTSNAGVAVSPLRKHSELPTEIWRQQKKGAVSFAHDSTSKLSEVRFFIS